MWLRRPNSFQKGAILIPFILVVTVLSLLVLLAVQAMELMRYFETAG